MYDIMYDITVLISNTICIENIWENNINMLKAYVLWLLAMFQNANKTFIS